MRTKALVIDLDGTLYAASKNVVANIAVAKRVYHYLSKNGILPFIPKHEMEKLEERMRAGSVSSSIRLLTDRSGLDYMKFSDYAYDVDPARIGIRRDPRLVSLLSKLSKTHRIFIFTNSPMIWAWRTIRVLGLERVVRKRDVISQDVLAPNLKPQAEAFITMLKRSRLKRDEITFLDDNRKNVAMSRWLNIRSIRVSNEGRDGRHSIYSILERMQYKDKHGDGK